uniref:Prokineticin 1 n=1 Tax=Dicentrarchus labrax TaxID=13489 RepID=A0A8C4HI05_DICLA
MTDWRAGDPVQGAGETVNSCCPVLRVLREPSSPVAVMGFRAVLLSFLLVSLSWSKGAVITGACERDVQCGFGLCCAVSLWLRGLRMCVPRGVEGDECHPFSHKVGRNVLLSHSLLHTNTESHSLLAHTSALVEIQITSNAGRLAEALEKLLIAAGAIDLLHSEPGNQSHTSL